jgi:hypothetical protein
MWTSYTDTWNSWNTAQVLNRYIGPAQPASPLFFQMFL